MKKLKMILLLGGMILSGVAITACGNSQASTGEEATEQLGKEYTSAYICPMHCAGSGSDEPGTCPVCKMDYVANEAAGEDAHSHEGHAH